MLGEHRKLFFWLGVCTLRDRYSMFARINRLETVVKKDIGGRTRDKDGETRYGHSYDGTDVKMPG